MVLLSGTRRSKILKDSHCISVTVIVHQITEPAFCLCPSQFRADQNEIRHLTSGNWEVTRIIAYDENTDNLWVKPRGKIYLIILNIVGVKRSVCLHPVTASAQIYAFIEMKLKNDGKNWQLTGYLIYQIEVKSFHNLTSIWTHRQGRTRVHWAHPSQPCVLLKCTCTVIGWRWAFNWAGPSVPLFSLVSYFLSTEGSPRRRQLFRYVAHAVIAQQQLLTAFVLMVLQMYNHIVLIMNRRRICATTRSFAWCYY